MSKTNNLYIFKHDINNVETHIEDQAMVYDMLDIMFFELTARPKTIKAPRTAKKIKGMKKESYRCNFGPASPHMFTDITFQNMNGLRDSISIDAYGLKMQKPLYSFLVNDIFDTIKMVQRYKILSDLMFRKFKFFWENVMISILDRGDKMRNCETLYEIACKYYQDVGYEKPINRMKPIFVDCKPEQRGNIAIISVNTMVEYMYTMGFNRKYMLSSEDYILRRLYNAMNAYYRVKFVEAGDLQTPDPEDFMCNLVNLANSLRFHPLIHINIIVNNEKSVKTISSMQSLYGPTASDKTKRRYIYQVTCDNPRDECDYVKDYQHYYRMATNIEESDHSKYNTFTFQKSKKTKTLHRP